jgi:ribose transport system ATP-binding protein
MQEATNMSNLQDETTAPTILQLHSVSKHFGGVNALTQVDFDLRRGEVHGVVGENGAGKSTLMKILSGVYSEYDGEMVLNGKPVHFRSTANAHALGIGMIHQELTVFPDLTVAENIFNGNQPLSGVGMVRWKAMKALAHQHLHDLGIEVDVNSLMGSVPVGTQQMVEIARVIFSGANIIIMDEPTSALSLPETKRLFSFIERLRQQQKTIIFISHFLEDVLEVSDRVSVFRNGQRVTTRDAKGLTKPEIISLMLGSENRLLQQAYEEETVLNRRTTTQSGDVVLAVHHLSHAHDFQNVDFSLRAGEMLGLYGFVGAGQLQLGNCLFGALRPTAGTLELKGKAVKLRGTQQAKKLKIAYVPENRRDSLVLDQEIFKNVTLAHLNKVMPGMLRVSQEIKLAREKILTARVRPPDPLLPVNALSGGNQQKVVLAKWLVETPQLLILAEPTRGMDVSAKEDVLDLVHELRGQGVAILLISTEIETLLSNCTRVLVMSKGRITAELQGEQLTKENLLLHA